MPEPAQFQPQASLWAEHLIDELNQIPEFTEMLPKMAYSQLKSGNTEKAKTLLEGHAKYIREKMEQELHSQSEKALSPNEKNDLENQLREKWHQFEQGFLSCISQDEGEKPIIIKKLQKKASNMLHQTRHNIINS